MGTNGVSDNLDIASPSSFRLLNYVASNIVALRFCTFFERLDVLLSSSSGHDTERTVVRPEVPPVVVPLRMVLS